MTRICRPLFLFLLGLVTSTTSTRGQMVVVNNLGETEDYSPFLNTVVWQATSFTTDAQAYSLYGFTLSLAPFFLGTGYVVPRISLDNSGAPSGSTLETFTAQAVSSGGPVTFSSTGISLDPNTTYWLSLHLSSGDDLVWGATASSAQTGNWTIGDTMLKSTDSGSTWSTTQPFAGQFSITATPITVPEPQSMSVVMLALLGAYSTYARRRA